jgi:hypothetical protein
MFVEYIYKQYNLETTCRNISKLKHSVLIKKNKTSTKTKLITLSKTTP